MEGDSLDIDLRYPSYRGPFMEDPYFCILISLTNSPKSYRLVQSTSGTVEGHLIDFPYLLGSRFRREWLQVWGSHRCPIRMGCSEDNLFNSPGPNGPTTFPRVTGLSPSDISRFWFSEVCRNRSNRLSNGLRSTP